MSPAGPDCVVITCCGADFGVTMGVTFLTGIGFAEATGGGGVGVTGSVVVGVGAGTGGVDGTSVAEAVVSTASASSASCCSSGYCRMRYVPYPAIETQMSRMMM